MYGAKNVKSVKHYSGMRGGIEIIMDDGKKFVVSNNDPTFYDSITIIRQHALFVKDGSSRFSPTEYVFPNADVPKKFSDTQSDVLCRMVYGIYDARFYGVKYDSTDIRDTHTNTITSLLVTGLIKMSGYRHAKLTFKGFLVARKLFGKTYAQFVEQKQKELVEIERRNAEKNKIGHLVLSHIKETGVNNWIVDNTGENWVRLVAVSGHKKFLLTVTIGVGITNFHTDYDFVAETHASMNEVFAEIAIIGNVVKGL